MNDCTTSLKLAIWDAGAIDRSITNSEIEDVARAWVATEWPDTEGIVVSIRVDAAGDNIDVDITFPQSMVDDPKARAFHEWGGP